MNLPIDGDTPPLPPPLPRPSVRTTPIAREALLPRTGQRIPPPPPAAAPLVPALPPGPPPGLPSPTLGLDPTVERQLARMFGESLFGAWLSPAQYLAAGMNQRRSKSWTKRLGIVAGALLILAVGAYLAREGFSRQADRERAKWAHEVSAFLADGELLRTQRYLERLAPPALPLRREDPHLDLILRAEASLYRYHDANPARRARILPFLPTAAGSPARSLAYFTLVSRAERLAARTLLEGLVPWWQKSPELYAILASTLEGGKDERGARQAWDRSEALAPLWLPHRYQHAWFEFRAGRIKDASRIVQGMARVAPDSPWTKLAHRQFTPTAPWPDQPPRAPGAAPPPPAPLPPVGIYHQHLQEALTHLRTKDTPGARTRVFQALEAVAGQGPFLLDAFDLLVAERAFDLALDLTGLETWPHSNPIAKARIAALEVRRSAPVAAPASTVAPRVTDTPASRATPDRRARPGQPVKAAKPRKRAGKAKKAARRR